MEGPQTLYIYKLLSMRLLANQYSLISIQTSTINFSRKLSNSPLYFLPGLIRLPYRAIDQLFKYHLSFAYCSTNFIWFLSHIFVYSHRNIHFYLVSKYILN